MAIDKKVIKLKDLPLINKVYSDMKLVAAVPVGRQNFKVEAELIKGNKIESITGKMSNESGGRNSIYINFADGKIVPIYYFNGSDGKEGKEGFPGIIGEQGEAAEVPKNISYTKKLDIINSTKVHIIDGDGNVVETELTDEEIESWLKLPWSALRGKDMNEKLYELNEIFIDDDLYTKRFVDVSYIYAEFDTTAENEKVRIYNSDTNSHIIYKKIWTFEDSDLETYYIYNPVTGQYNEVLVNLWTDVYLRDKDTDYYEATSSQLTDGTALYYFDEKTNSYKEVTLLETTHIVNEIETTEYIGDKRFEWYSSHIDQDFIVNYTVSNDSYRYNLKNVNELEVSAYASDDLTNYYKVIFVQNANADWVVYDEDRIPLTNTDGTEKIIDLSSVNVYYQLVKDENGNDTYQLISNFSEFLSRPNPRYYLVNSDSSLTEVESLDNINTNNYDRYIVETIEGSVYTYEYFYPTVLYEGTANEQKFYSENVLVLEHGTITLYSKDEDRKYYYKTNEVDSDGNPIYKEISAIDWIYAEYITTDEDENVKLLNALSGEEDDNTQTDTANEDYVIDYVHVPMNIIIPGNKTIYKKVSLGKYSILDFNEYNSANDYYILPEEITYEKITAQQVRDNYLTEVYIKTVDDEGKEVYSLNRASISDDVDYYVVKYEKLENSEEYLTNTNVDLVIGVPQILPINIYPTNSTDRNLVIEYDTDYIKVYEDGSICAVNNSLAKLSTDTDYQGTIMKVLYEDEEGNILLSATIHINLIIPVEELTIESNYNKDEFYSLDTLDERLAVETNTEVEFRVSYSPNPSSYADFIWSVEGIDDFEVSDDTLSMKVNIPEQGDYRIEVMSNDGFKAKSSYTITVLEPAQYIVINDDLNKVVEYYTDEEAYNFNEEHAAEIAAGEIEAIVGEGYATADKPATIKEQYYLFNCLMGKDYFIDDIITVEPENTTRKIFDLTSSNNELASIVDSDRLIIVEEGYEKEATQDDIDNGVATEIGEIISIPAITRRETAQAIRTYAAGTCDITGTLSEYPDVRFVDKEYNDIVTISNGVKTEDGTVRIRLNIKQAITEINIVPQTVLLNIGEEKLVTAVVTPSSGVNMKDFTWKATPETAVEFIPADASDPTKMYIKGLEGGAALINAYSGDGSGVNTEYHPCTIKVTIPTKNINLYKDETKVNDIIYVGVGDTKNIVYEIEYQSRNTSSANTEDIKWSSENPEIASVENAVVTGNSVGTTTIIGYAGDSTGVFGSIVVEVIRLNTSISFDFNSVDMEVDDTLVLVPKFGEVNGEQSSNQVVVWDSSNPEVAKIKSSGIIYALKRGTSTITATTTDGTNLTASCTVTVN